MPEDIVLHKRHALALYRVRDNDRGLVRFVVSVGERAAQRVVIVTVKPYDVPPERTPFCAEILKLKRIFAIIKALHAVMVYHRDKIFKPVMICKQRCLPDRTLVALTVAENGKNAVRLAVLHGGERHTGGSGKSVSERAR